MKITWRRSVRGAAILVALGVLATGLPHRAVAAGSSADDRPADPDYAAAVKAIKAEKFAAAIPLLEGVVKRDTANADAYNWLAYATRKTGDPAASIPLYEKALALDLKHRGAHEYIGEEYRDLKKAVESYEKTGKTSTTR